MNFTHKGGGATLFHLIFLGGTNFPQAILLLRGDINLTELRIKLGSLPQKCFLKNPSHRSTSNFENSEESNLKLYL